MLCSSWLCWLPVEHCRIAAVQRQDHEEEAARFRRQAAASTYSQPLTIFWHATSRYVKDWSQRIDLEAWSRGDTIRRVCKFCESVRLSAPPTHSRSKPEKSWAATFHRQVLSCIFLQFPHLVVHPILSCVGLWTKSVYIWHCTLFIAISSAITNYSMSRRQHSCTCTNPVKDQCPSQQSRVFVAKTVFCTWRSCFNVWFLGFKILLHIVSCGKAQLQFQKSKEPGPKQRIVNSSPVFSRWLTPCSAAAVWSGSHGTFPSGWASKPWQTASDCKWMQVTSTWFFMMSLRILRRIPVVSCIPCPWFVLATFLYFPFVPQPLQCLELGCVMWCRSNVFLQDALWQFRRTTMLRIIIVVFLNGASRIRYFLILVNGMPNPNSKCGVGNRVLTPWRFQLLRAMDMSSFDSEFRSDAGTELAYIIEIYWNVRAFPIHTRSGKPQAKDTLRHYETVTIVMWYVTWICQGCSLGQPIKTPKPWKSTATALCAWGVALTRRSLRSRARAESETRRVLLVSSSGADGQMA